MAGTARSLSAVILDWPIDVIFVSLGTHPQPMMRLVPALKAIALRLPELGPFNIQRGNTPLPDGWTGTAFMDPDQMAEAMQSSDIVISHCGPATIALARSFGRLPIAVPRLHFHREHVDDHQRWYARRLSDAQEIVLVEDVDELLNAVATHSVTCQRLPPPVSVDPAKAIDEFALLVEKVLGLPPGRSEPN